MDDDSLNVCAFDCWYLFPEKIPFCANDGAPFIVADFGCHDGGFSVPLLQKIIGKGPEFAVRYGHAMMTS